MSDTVRTIDYTVVGEQKIHCAGCEQRIGNALRRVPGVEDVEASLRTQEVRVAIDPSRVGPADVQAKLEQLGYEVAPKA